MKPLKRRPVSKVKSASNFKRNVGKTKAANVAPTPMRGGYRL